MTDDQETQVGDLSVSLVRIRRVGGNRLSGDRHTCLVGGHAIGGRFVA